MSKESCEVSAGQRIGNVVLAGDMLCLEREAKIGKKAINGLQGVVCQLASGTPFVDNRSDTSIVGAHQDTGCMWWKAGERI